MSAHPKYPASQEGYKVCPKCLVEKPLTHEYWHKSRARKDGFNGWCRTCQTAKRVAHQAISENRLRRNATDVANRQVMRYEVLAYYGGTPPTCSCEGCTVSELEWLTLDHIAGGGRQHRRTFRGPLDRWLYRNDFPDGFRVLCMNCNHSLGQYGYCPHQEKGL